MAPTLIVDPADMARRLGLADPTPAQIERISDAIADCTADVEAELNRPLVPYEATMTQIVPMPGYDLTSWRAWPQASERYDDEVEPTLTVANTDGTFDVTFRVGLDGANDSRVTRFIRAHVKETLRNDTTDPLVERVVTSASAEGQSLSFAAASTTKGTAGALPDMSSLRALKRRSAYTRPRGPVAIWPYSGTLGAVR